MFQLSRYQSLTASCPFQCHGHSQPTQNVQQGHWLIYVDGQELLECHHCKQKSYCDRVPEEYTKASRNYVTLSALTVSRETAEGIKAWSPLILRKKTDLCPGESTLHPRTQSNCPLFFFVHIHVYFVIIICHFKKTGLHDTSIIPDIVQQPRSVSAWWSYVLPYVKPLISGSFSLRLVCTIQSRNWRMQNHGLLPIVRSPFSTESGHPLHQQLLSTNSSEIEHPHLKQCC